MRQAEFLLLNSREPSGDSGLGRGGGRVGNGGRTAGWARGGGDAGSQIPQNQAGATTSAARSGVSPNLVAAAAAAAEEITSPGVQMAERSQNAVSCDVSERMVDAEFSYCHTEKRWLLFGKWAIPGLVGAVCFFMQNFMLYASTYYYILWMDRIHESSNGGTLPCRPSSGRSLMEEELLFSQTHLAEMAFSGSPRSLSQISEIAHGSVLPGVAANSTTRGATSAAETIVDDVTATRAASVAARSEQNGNATSTTAQNVSGIPESSRIAVSEGELVGNTEGLALRGTSRSGVGPNMSNSSPQMSSYGDGASVSKTRANHTQEMNFSENEGSNQTTEDADKRRESNNSSASTWTKHLESDFREGSLEDKFENLLGEQVKAKMWLLDLISVFLPFLFFTMTALRGDVHLWTKCCLIASIMALLKGFLAWATVVPDSIGWSSCKSRLGPGGLAFFRSDTGIDFDKDFWGSSGRVFVMELFGAIVDGQYTHLRFCADMMFSGHTYATTIFSLGLYDLVRNQTARWTPCRRSFVRFVVGAVLLAVVLSEMYMMLVQRFHYTMDVVVALVFTLLMYSNPAIAVVADFWASEFDGSRRILPSSSSTRRTANEWGSDVRHDRGAVLVPPCCVPFCCISGRYSLYDRPDLQELFSSELRQVEQDCEEQVDSIQRRLREQEEVSRTYNIECNDVKTKLEVTRRQMKQVEQAHGRMLEVDRQAKQTIALRGEEIRDLHVAIEHERSERHKADVRVKVSDCHVETLELEIRKRDEALAEAEAALLEAKTAAEKAAKAFADATKEREENEAKIRALALAAQPAVNEKSSADEHEAVKIGADQEREKLATDVTDTPQTAIAETEQLSPVNIVGNNSTEAVARQLPSGPRVCILGGTEFKDGASAAIVQELGRAFTARLAGRVVVLTGGMPGVQQTFATTLGSSFPALVHLLPEGKASGFDVGEDIVAGATLPERMVIFGELGDIYIAVEGGPGVASEAAAAFTRGALVLPLMSTGGASSGMFNFPAGALQRPPVATVEQWSSLREKAAPEVVAAAVVGIIQRHLEATKLEVRGDVAQDHVKAVRAAATKSLPRQMTPSPRRANAPPRQPPRARSVPARAKSVSASRSASASSMVTPIRASAAGEAAVVNLFEAAPTAMEASRVAAAATESMPNVPATPSREGSSATNVLVDMATGIVPVIAGTPKGESALSVDPFVDGTSTEQTSTVQATLVSATPPASVDSLVTPIGALPAADEAGVVNPFEATPTAVAASPVGASVMEPMPNVLPTASQEDSAATRVLVDVTTEVDGKVQAKSFDHADVFS